MTVVDDADGVDKLLNSAKELADAFQYEMAEEHVRHALELIPDSIEALQLHASILIELGQVKQAFQILLRTVELEPEGGPEKYLALAQLCEGREALAHYGKAVNLIMNHDDGKLISCNDKFRACTAMCAVAELFMTDLCEEPDAEERCETALRSAAAICPESNPELYRVECDLRLVQQRPADAATAMQHCLASWATLEEEGGSVESSTTLISWDFRLSVARLMIELGEFFPHYYDQAEVVLEQLIDQDDEAALPWYLLGVCCVTRQDGDAETASECFERAQELLLLVPEEDRDIELLDSVNHFLNR